MPKTKLRIKEIATEKGFNISQLSRKTDLDIGLVRRYWHNRTQSISLPALDKIAEVLGVRVIDLIEDKRSDYE